MSDEDWECGCSDLATERAAALCELALNVSGVREPRAKKAMLRAIDLLADGIETAVRPSKKSANPLVLFQRPEPDAS